MSCTYSIASGSHTAARRRARLTTDRPGPSPRSLALLNIRYHPRGIDDSDALGHLNHTLLETVNDGRRLYVTQNRVRGAYAIRISIGQTTTERRHVEAAWETIQATGAHALLTARAPTLR